MECIIQRDVRKLKSILNNTSYSDIELMVRTINITGYVRMLDVIYEERSDVGLEHAVMSVGNLNTVHYYYHKYLATKKAAYKQDFEMHLYKKHYLFASKILAPHDLSHIATMVYHKATMKRRLDISLSSLLHLKSINCDVKALRGKVKKYSPLIDQLLGEEVQPYILRPYHEAATTIQQWWRRHRGEG